MSAVETCPDCGMPRTHYLTHACPNCTCHRTPVTDFYEPHIQFPDDVEFNPECPAHGDHRTIPEPDSPASDERTGDDD